MKTVQRAIEECIPCNVCGNNEISKFELRGTIKDGQKSIMIVCDECDEVYPVSRDE